MFNNERIKLSELSDVLSGQYKPDVFITSISYESRCLSVASKITPLLTEVGFIYACINETASSLSLENYENFETGLANLQKVTTSKDDPFKSADNFVSMFELILGSDAKRILIDVTCFTKETLLILIAVLDQVLDEDVRVVLCYNPAKSYCNSSFDKNIAHNKNTEDLWLSKGLKEIRSVLGFSGNLSPSKDIHLVILTGFDSERSISLINEIEPTSLTLGIATNDHFAENFSLIHKRFLQEIQAIHPNYETIDFSPSDPFSVTDKLINVFDKHKDKNLVIAPLNSKISTLGLMKAVFARPDIQICYAVPEEYNEKHYSLASELCVLIDLKLLTDRNIEIP